MRLARYRSFWMYLVALAAGGTLLSAAPAQATMVTFTASGVDGNLPMEASATITVNDGAIVVQLTNLEPNVTSVFQEISGIQITLGGLSSTGAVALTSATGTLININSNGSYYTSWSSINNWGTSTSGGTFTLSTDTNDLIIGAPDSNNLYSNSDSSISNNDPTIKNTGTFYLTVANATSDTTVTNAIFSFGTGASDPWVNGTNSSQVPEPTSLLMFGTALLALGVFARGRRTRRVSRQTLSQTAAV